jgi:hypothetical protein
MSGDIGATTTDLPRIFLWSEKTICILFWLHERYEVCAYHGMQLSMNRMPVDV